MVDRAARFGAIMAMLWAAHDIADHVVQTDHQAATKSGDWRGMAGHIGTYHLTQVAAIAALRGLGVRPTPARMIMGILFSAGSHAFLDRRWPVTRLLERTGSARFADPEVRVWGHMADAEIVFDHVHEMRGSGPLPLHGPYLADQALHHVCLAVVAYILAGGDR